ncbi:putative bifunctional diguanylate cyclase/phosphodiesterase [Rhodoferax sp.]|uniref:putative bifunctional diguanylate cyclase/phosphodiesterase n=1 Tax=Rhodoferax sp. TaxID=50421 RepID=UPI00374D5A22
MKLDAANEAYEALIQFLYRAPIGLAQTSLDGGIEMANPMSAQLLMPVSPDGSLENLFTTLSEVAPHLRGLVEAFAAPSGVVCESVRIPLQPDARGEAAPQVLSFSLLKLDATRLMAVINDATLEVQREQQGLARRLSAAARVDNLTRMPKRAVALERLQQAMQRGPADAGYAFGVLFLNCDRLKQINDAQGHAAGDEVLSMLADRLRASLRSHKRSGLPNGGEHMAARIGGDEFVVVLDNLEQPDDVHAIAQRLLDVLAKPYGVGPHQLHCSVSMGIVLRAQATGDADAVLQMASIAMVEAKRAGGGRYVVFEPGMHARATQRAGIEAELRLALVETQLFVMYQPVVGLLGPERDDGSVDRSTGVEALVRWRHPTRGVVPPFEFIGVAEECGLIGALGDFVLATACRQFVHWQATLGPRAPRLLAVNLSRAQLAQPGWVAYVAELLRSTGMAPAQLQLEVTESLAAQDENVQARLHELKALGLTLALDDFGTGYSSLASLHQLPVDIVKIDRSFVCQADTSPHHRVLIEATVRVAHSLGMGTVAEGIETAAQAAVVRELQCEKGQGYLFSRPLMPEDLAQWINAPGFY